MKDEFWSIRKMREDQKFSQTRNTYKEKEEGSPVNIRQDREGVENPILNRFMSRIQLFLEE